MPSRGTRLMLVALAILLGASAATAETVRPYERDDWATPMTPIDEFLEAALTERGIPCAHPCSDEVFFRRIYIDVLGVIPDPISTARFLEDARPEKRRALVNTLLAREEFADYWSLKWCDVLRVKAEFPINLWPNAVQAYHRWVYEAVKTNKPYDQFARELLTSNGSNFRVPPVNFYRAVQAKEPAALADAAALTFMGSRIAGWPEDRRAGTEALFSRVAYKGTAEWKEEIVYLDPEATEPLEATLPDGTNVRVEAGDDPREAFADWLITPENPWFAKSIVNRIWAWLFGRGIIHEPDDIRDDNPPIYPELLGYLEQELVTHNYDLRHIYRLILNSRVYQQSPIPQSDDPEVTALFAHYPVRRLDAEVLIDALCWVTSSQESYESRIPEPFTYIPEELHTVELADGSITSPYLEMYGRPSRDTGLLSERNNSANDSQRLHLLNSSHVQQKIERSWRIQLLVRTARGNQQKLVSSLYLNILSRFPTGAEMTAAEAYFRDGGLNFTLAARDLAWALLNSKEFLYRH